MFSHSISHAFSVADSLQDVQPIRHISPPYILRTSDVRNPFDAFYYSATGKAFPIISTVKNTLNSFLRLLQTFLLGHLRLFQNAIFQSLNIGSIFLIYYAIMN